MSDITNFFKLTILERGENPGRWDIEQNSNFVKIDSLLQELSSCSAGVSEPDQMYYNFFGKLWLKVTDGNANNIFGSIENRSALLIQSPYFASGGTKWIAAAFHKHDGSYTNIGIDKINLSTDVKGLLSNEFIDPSGLDVYSFGGIEFNNFAQSMSNQDCITSILEDGINKFTLLNRLNHSTPQTANKITVDKYGIVTSFSYETTLAGIGITNAYTKAFIDDAILNLSNSADGKAPIEHDEYHADAFHIKGGSSSQSFLVSEPVANSNDNSVPSTSWIRSFIDNVQAVRYTDNPILGESPFLKVKTISTFDIESALYPINLTVGDARFSNIGHIHTINNDGTTKTVNSNGTETLNSITNFKEYLHSNLLFLNSDNNDQLVTSAIKTSSEYSELIPGDTIGIALARKKYVDDAITGLSNSSGQSINSLVQADVDLGKRIDDEIQDRSSEDSTLNTKVARLHPLHGNTDLLTGLPMAAPLTLQCDIPMIMSGFDVPNWDYTEGRYANKLTFNTHSHAELYEPIGGRAHNHEGLYVGLEYLETIKSIKDIEYSNITFGILKSPLLNKELLDSIENVSGRILSINSALTDIDNIVLSIPNGFSKTTTTLMNSLFYIGANYSGKGDVTVDANSKKFVSLAKIAEIDISFEATNDRFISDIEDIYLYGSRVLDLYPTVDPYSTGSLKDIPEYGFIYDEGTWVAYRVKIWNNTFLTVAIANIGDNTPYSGEFTIGGTIPLFNTESILDPVKTTLFTLIQSDKFLVQNELPTVGSFSDNDLCFSKNQNRIYRYDSTLLEWIGDELDPQYIIPVAFVETDATTITNISPFSLEDYINKQVTSSLDQNIIAFRNTNHLFVPTAERTVKIRKGYNTEEIGFINNGAFNVILDPTDDGTKILGASLAYILEPNHSLYMKADNDGNWYGIGGHKPLVLQYIPPTWELINSSQVLESNKNYFVDTNTTAFQVTLPPNPDMGDSIRVVDVMGTFTTNNLTVLRNGKLIMGLADDKVLNTNNDSVMFVFSDDASGWRLV